MISLFSLLIALLLALSTCQFAIGLPGIPSIPGNGGDDTSVEGTVSYRERLALTPGATLVVELRDVSLADAASILIASQTIFNPGQVPIEYSVEYDEADIDPRRTYSINATIYESDGRMAFTNDTAYEVITRGNPSRVDMWLVMVQPPPSETGDNKDPSWVEAPVRMVSASMRFDEPDPLLRLIHHQSTVEGCARRGDRSLGVEGKDVIVTLSLMQPPETPWAIPCDEHTVEVDEIFLLDEEFSEGVSYRIVVNGQQWATFTPPDPALGYTHVAKSAVRAFEIEKADGIPASYQLRVVSGRPSGSCTRVNGYEITRRDPNTIEVAITHHQVSDPNAACTKDFPITETIVPLGSALEAGQDYTVVVNGEARTFTP